MKKIQAYLDTKIALSNGGDLNILLVIDEQQALFLLQDLVNQLAMKRDKIVVNLNVKDETQADEN